MYAKSNFKKELWSTIFTSEPSKSQYKQNGSKYVITLCQSVFLGFNNYWVLLHKINFHCRISMPESLFPLFVFHFSMSRASIMFTLHRVPQSLVIIIIHGWTITNWMLWPFSSVFTFALKNSTEENWPTGYVASRVSQKNQKLKIQKVTPLRF